jgi:hypothetical protein
MIALGDKCRHAISLPAPGSLRVVRENDSIPSCMQERIRLRRDGPAHISSRNNRVKHLTAAPPAEGTGWLTRFAHLTRHEVMVFELEHHAKNN